jgi:hypothetical protein
MATTSSYMEHVLVETLYLFVMVVILGHYTLAALWMAVWSMDGGLSTGSRRIVFKIATLPSCIVRFSLSQRLGRQGQTHAVCFLPSRATSYVRHMPL